MNWKDPYKEWPKEGDHVAVLIYHWKEKWPDSGEIYFGECEKAVNQFGVRIGRVVNSDYTGGGSEYWTLPCIECGGDSNEIRAWCYASEFKKPDFISHNESYGKLEYETRPPTEAISTLQEHLFYPPPWNIYENEERTKGWCEYQKHLKGMKYSLKDDAWSRYNE